MKTCFIVCPIGQDGSAIRKNSDQLLRHVLKPVCEQCGFKCVRVDGLNSSDSITETILDYLRNSELVIADLSTHNPNAFFELGFRTAIGKPVIHLKEKTEKIPFDVSSIRTFDYNLQDLDSVSELKERLVRTIESFHFPSEPTSESSAEASESALSQILPELYKIEDQLKEIRQAVDSRDTAAVSVLADKIAANSTPEPLEATLLKTIFGNPDALKTIYELGKKQKQN